MANDWARPGLEPRVEEMVRDPIVQLVMHRDRLTLSEIMATVARARARLQPGARLDPPSAGQTAEPFIAQESPARS
jgi:hypothetical protein